MSRPTSAHKIRELGPSDTALLRRFYDDCYVPEFPDADERESLQNIEDYLQRKADGWYGKNNYHVVVATDENGAPLGGSISDYLDKPNAGVLEYILVRPELRGSGLGHRLLQHTEHLLHTDGVRNHGQLDWIVGEMDDPYRTPVTADSFDPFARARIWHHWKYRRLDFRYIQPALSPNQSPVENLLLMANTCSPRYGATVPSKDVQLLVAEYLRWAMRIPEPTDNHEYREMASALELSGTVALTPFDEYVSGIGKEELYISEVVTDQDPEMAEAIRVYSEIFTDPSTAVPSAYLTEALTPGGLINRQGYRYHLWTIRGAAEQKAEGIASFLTMPHAGFGGYVGFDPILRGTGLLRSLIMRIEERMVRDIGELGMRIADIPGWYIECDGDTNRTIFSGVGFQELDITYEQPAITPGPCRVLHLMYKPFGRVYQQAVIDRTAFLDAMEEIYQAIYRVDPDQSDTFSRLHASLEGSRTVTATALRQA
ncbi:GNAT family N-acetyltransferase [Nocardia sp. NPDC046473]|uniref:GNAT family N-acetyltransferase n=1 Tax=Nocardia sp. NPDC046473 TaxID=3155733 RepID=UPI0033EA35C2